MKRKSKIFFLLLSAFFILRLVAAFFVGQGAVPGDDSYGYNSYALNIVQGTQWLRSSDFVGSFREPGYPLFLALIYRVFGEENFWAVYGCQALLNLVMAVFVCRLTSIIFNRTVGIVAFVLAGCHGFYLWYGACILREIMVYTLFFSFFYLFYRLQQTTIKHGRYLFSAAVVLFLLVHTDSRYLYLSVCVPILCVVYRGWIKGLKQCAAIGMVVVALSIPWGIRNAKTYGQFVWISPKLFNPGFNPWTAVKEMPWFSTAFSVQGDVSRERFLPAPQTPEEKKAQQKGIKPSVTPWGRRWFNLKQLWRVCLKDGVYTPYPGAYFRVWSLRHNVMSIFSYGILLPFMILGCIGVLINHRKTAALFLVPILVHTALHAMICGEARYRVPLDSFLIILGAYGLYISFLFIKSKMCCSKAKDRIGEQV